MDYMMNWTLRYSPLAGFCCRWATGGATSLPVIAGGLDRVRMVRPFEFTMRTTLGPLFTHCPSGTVHSQLRAEYSLPAPLALASPTTTT